MATDRGDMLDILFPIDGSIPPDIEDLTLGYADPTEGSEATALLQELPENELKFKAMSGGSRY